MAPPPGACRNYTQDGFTVMLDKPHVVLTQDLTERSRHDRQHILRLLRSRYKDLRFSAKHGLLEIRTRITSQVATRADYHRRRGLIRQAIGEFKTVIRTALRERELNTPRQHPKRRKPRTLFHQPSPKYPLNTIPTG